MKTQFVQIFGGYKPRASPSFILNLGLDRHKSFQTVFEWPKSVKEFSSYVSAKMKSVGR